MNNTAPKKDIEQNLYELIEKQYHSSLRQEKRLDRITIFAVLAVIIQVVTIFFIDWRFSNIF